ncbi:MAG: rRNA maturation RNase YbeY [Chitinophagales bacterium]|nr:rRNA maturation RNase YbeY [Chitinophagales bacterium]MDW8394115.1 rRNA maturation RNase YbeY [Chitinophagales bacterium]
MAVTFACLAPGFRLQQSRILRTWLLETAQKEKATVKRLHVVLTTDKHIFNLNKKFLNHSWPTDVLTFSYAAPGFPLEAEVYISVDRVADNARRFHEPFVRELHRVMIHGLLHCLGYSDRNRNEAARMRRAENRYLALLSRTN